MNKQTSEIKEPADVGASAGSGTEMFSAISNNDYTPKTAGCQAPAKMYVFDGGAVRLEFSGGRYHVYLNGAEQLRSFTPTQMANPRIAVMLFVSCIGEYLGGKVGDHLVSRGFNRVMGCRIDLMCADCRAWGLDTTDNMCRFLEDSP